MALDFSTNRIARRVSIFHQINAMGDFLNMLGEDQKHPAAATDEDRLARLRRRLVQVHDDVDGPELEAVLVMLASDIFEWLEELEQRRPIAALPTRPHLRVVG